MKKTREPYYTMPHYYSWWLKILVWIHVYSEMYCSRWCGRTHHAMYNDNPGPSKIENLFAKFVMSPFEFRLRKITDHFKNIAKAKYRKKLDLEFIKTL
jgi:hypothetical protein